MFLIVELLLFITQVAPQAVDLPCILAPAVEADWFVLSKLPGTADAASLGKILTSAAAGAFADSMILGTNENAAGIRPTLKKFLEKQAENADKAKVAAVSYSNHPPQFRKALQSSPAKGIVLMGENKGSWIIHTLPKFAELSVTAADFKYTLEQKAGLIVCVTMKNEEIPKIFQSLIYTDAIQYFVKPGDSAPASKDESTQKFIKGEMPDSSPFAISVSMKTDANMDVRVFGKSGFTAIDIFSRYITVLLSSSIRVRFDDTHRDRIPNSCFSTFKTENIGGDIMLGGKTIKANQEGSVWAITGEPAPTMFCISNSPRTTTQEKLGSSVTCISQADVARHFKTVADTSTTQKCQ